MLNQSFLQLKGSGDDECKDEPNDLVNQLTVQRLEIEQLKEDL